MSKWEPPADVREFVERAFDHADFACMRWDDVESNQDAAGAMRALAEKLRGMAAMIDQAADMLDG